jgi:hypothetical protein
MTTTELSSLSASSTTSLFGDFLRSRIAVEKSFFTDFLQFKAKTYILSNKVSEKEKQNL